MTCPVRVFTTVAIGVAALTVSACSGSSAPVARTSTPVAPTTAPGTSDPVTSAPTSSSPTASPTPTAPAVGTTLATLTGQGRMNVIPSASGFDWVNSLEGDGAGDLSKVVAYDVDGTQLGTVESGSFTGECGASDVTNSAGRLILTEKIVETPAAGITPATYAVTMTAWSASSGAEVWTSTVVPAGTDGISCTAYSGYLEDFAATSDGAWGAYTRSGSEQAIDLVTGKTYVDPTVFGVLGTSIVRRTTTTAASGEETTTRTLGLPPAWTPRGSFVSDAPGRPDLTPFGVGGPASGSITGTGDGTALTVGGGTLVTSTTADNSYDVTLRAFSLPAGTATWSRPVPAEPSVVGTTATRVILAFGGSGTTAAHLEAISAGTGATAWTLPDAMVCGVTSSEMLLSVNDQLAVIDLASGKQLSYSADSNDGCSTLLTGGIGVDSSGIETVTVTQVLTP